MSTLIDLTIYLTLRQRAHGLELHQKSETTMLMHNGRVLNTWTGTVAIQTIWTEADVVVCQMDSGVSFEGKVK